MKFWNKRQPNLLDRNEQFRWKSLRSTVTSGFVTIIQIEHESRFSPRGFLNDINYALDSRKRSRMRWDDYGSSRIVCIQCLRRVWEPNGNAFRHNISFTAKCLHDCEYETTRSWSFDAVSFVREDRMQVSRPFDPVTCNFPTQDDSFDLNFDWTFKM